MRAGKRQGGFTYIGVLFLLVLMGLGLAGTGEAWSMASRRARERELLWVGNQYARAIKAYYLQSPGVRQFPSQLEDLLEDRRFPEPRRHLRQLYVDPITRDRFEPVLSDDGRIGGVRSKSDGTPLKQDNFPARFRDFKGTTHYADWLFIVDNVPGAPRRPQTAGTDAGTGTAAAGTPATAGTPAAGTSAGTSATPGSPATATPTTADTGTPGSVGPGTGAATVTSPPKPAPVKPGPVISFTR